jgi:hypothetical protein
MRATLVLNGQFFRCAKQKVVVGVNLSDLVNTALRNCLLQGSGRQVGKESFSRPVFGDAAGVHRSPVELAALRDEGC